MRLLLAANNQATRRNEIIKSYLQLGSSSNRYAPGLPNKKQNHLQNSLLRRTQFWVRKTFSKPASLKRASLVGTPAQQQCPPLNSTLAQRTKEEWARTLCENKAVAIIQRMQEGKPALIPKECEEILIAIVLDRPLKEAQRLVENPERFFNEILEALETHRNHPVLMQLLHDRKCISIKHCQPNRWTASNSPSTIPIDNNIHTTASQHPQQFQSPWGTHSF